MCVRVYACRRKGRKGRDGEVLGRLVVWLFGHSVVDVVAGLTAFEQNMGQDIDDVLDGTYRGIQSGDPQLLEYRTVKSIYCTAPALRKLCAVLHWMYMYNFYFRLGVSAFFSSGPGEASCMHPVQDRTGRDQTVRFGLALHRISISVVLTCTCPHRTICTCR